jgi:hypothetical protein
MTTKNTTLMPATTSSSIATLRPFAVVCRRRLGGFRARFASVASVTVVRGDAGMATAEYAIGTVAACAFAAILYKVVTSGAVSGAVASLLDRALHAV